MFRKQKFIGLNVDSEVVQIPVSDAVYAYWDEQFARARTPQQKRRFATFKNVVREAYKKGREDGGQRSESRKANPSR